MTEQVEQRMFAEIEGTRLYFERYGAGPTLLFVHGTRLDHRMWRAQVEALPHAGHMANMEDPAAVTRAIEGLAATAP